MDFNKRKENMINNAESLLARCQKLEATKDSCRCSDFDSNGACVHTSVMEKLELEGFLRTEYVYPLEIDESTGQLVTILVVDRVEIHNHLLMLDASNKRAQTVSLPEWESKRPREVHVPILDAVRREIQQAQAV